MKLLSYFRGKAFQRGVHPPSCKLTADRAIRRLPFPPKVTVPLSQHIGKTPRPIVRVGQEVVRGQPIARSDEWLSATDHAPLSGVVEFIGLRPYGPGDPVRREDDLSRTRPRSCGRWDLTRKVRRVVRMPW